MIVHNGWGSLEASVEEIKGFKDSGRFLFSERASINKGSVLQIKGGSDYWKVYDTEEEIVGDILVLFTALVTKIDERGQETRPSRQAQNVFNAPIKGGVQIGGANNIQKVDIDPEEEE